MTIFENISGGVGYHATLKIAIRTCIRILNISTAGWNEIELCDRQVDAGEYSGPAWGDIWQDEEARVIRLVALRFDISHIQLGEALMCWNGNEADCEMDAMFPDISEQKHKPICQEYWDRGLNCMCIPQEEQDRIKAALKRGEDIDDIIDPSWGPN